MIGCDGPHAGYGKDENKLLPQMTKASVKEANMQPSPTEKKNLSGEGSTETLTGIEQTGRVLARQKKTFKPKPYFLFS